MWMKLIEKDLEKIKVKVNLMIKYSHKNTKSIEVSTHAEIAKCRHVWNLAVDCAVSDADGGA